MSLKFLSSHLMKSSFLQSNFLFSFKLQEVKVRRILYQSFCQNQEFSYRYCSFQYDLLQASSEFKQLKFSHSYHNRFSKRYNQKPLDWYCCPHSKEIGRNYFCSVHYDCLDNLRNLGSSPSPNFDCLFWISYHSLLFLVCSQNLNLNPISWWSIPWKLDEQKVRPMKVYQILSRLSIFWENLWCHLKDSHLLPKVWFKYF